MWQVAMMAGQAGLGFLQGRQQAKAQKAWQRYRNTMTNLSAAGAVNSINSNEQIFRDTSTMEAIDIKKSFLESTASNAVSAAAAGVKGRSVNQVLFDVKRNADMAEGNRQIKYAQATNAFQQQRQNAAMSAAMQQDYSYIPEPSAIGALLGFGMGVGKEANWSSSGLKSLLGFGG